MTFRFHVPNRTVRLIACTLGGLVLMAMQAGCAREPVQTSDQSLAKAQVEQAGRPHGVESVSNALGERLDQMLLGAGAISQR